MLKQLFITNNRKFYQNTKIIAHNYPTLKIQPFTYYNKRNYSRKSTLFCEIDKSGSSPASLTDVVPGVVHGGEKLIMFYTCKVCETRSVKKISKSAYHHGCVLVRCPSCKNLHLIADHKNVFEDGDWDIQKYLESRGETVKVVTDDSGVFELTERDIAGSSLNKVNEGNLASDPLAPVK